MQKITALVKTQHRNNPI